MLMRSYSESLAISLAVGVAAGASWWWWRKQRKNSKGPRDIELGKGGKRDEENPLLSRRGQVANVISIWEQQEAAIKNSKQTKRSKVTPIHSSDKAKKKSEPAQRCPACRKTFSPSAIGSSSVVFDQQRIHAACFQCSDCQANLQMYASETVHQYKANVRIKFRCPICRQNSHNHNNVIQHKIGRVVIGPNEQGDTQQALEKIGDDLTEAVYFMHPKCAVCGGDFQPKHNMASRHRRGNWRYHTVCWEAGKPAVAEEMKAYRKLSPAHSAKYLPAQIILQLLENNPRRILTTLYFVWKGRETEWKQLRQEVISSDNASLVVIPYSLDERAPANPNFVPHTNTPRTKRRRQQETSNLLLLPAIETVQLKLLAADEVAPRPPFVVEPVSIVTCQDDDVNITDGDVQSSSFLCAKLEYLKFGLSYTLTLNIPIVSFSATRTAELADEKEEENALRQINLTEAQLSVTIQE